MRCSRINIIKTRGVLVLRLHTTPCIHYCMVPRANVISAGSKERYGIGDVQSVSRLRWHGQFRFTSPKACLSAGQRRVLCTRLDAARWRNSQQNSLRSTAQYTSGNWHHDRCGARLKAFLEVSAWAVGRPSAFARRCLERLSSYDCSEKNNVCYSFV